MKIQPLSKASSVFCNEKDVKIRITIAKSEKMAEKERRERVRNAPLTIEEKIIKYYPCTEK